MQCYYFGWREPHQEHPRLYGPDGEPRRPLDVLPFAPSLLEGWLLPQGGIPPQGHVYLAIVLGWTVLSFWDRSVKTSLSSTGAFVLDGVPAQVDGKGFAQAVEIAAHAFPWVVERLPGPLTPGRLPAGARAPARTPVRSAGAAE